MGVRVGEETGPATRERVRTIAAALAGANYPDARKAWVVIELADGRESVIRFTPAPVVMSRLTCFGLRRSLATAACNLFPDAVSVYLCLLSRKGSKPTQMDIPLDC